MLSDSGTAIGLGVGLVALLGMLAVQSGAALLPPADGLAVALLALLSVAAFAQWRRVRRPVRSALLAAAPDVPDDAAELAAVARRQFLALQAAWDRGDVAALGALTTAEMLRELLEQLPVRSPANRTDVLKLDAHVLRVERLGAIELASIEFSGIVRESAERGPVPFHELWMLARSQGEPWRLARQQALM